MKKIFVISMLLFLALQILAQTPRFSKYEINQTGYFCYFPGNPGNFEVQTSEDGLKIYLGETSVSDCKYGLILVILEYNFETSTKEELQDLLISYMDHLKTSYEISGEAGYSKGHTMDSNPNAQGIIDFWENSAGLQYAVKGWIDKNALCFLYISGKELPYINYQNLFLNGFRFKN
jgi:hypothetical protein